MALARCILGRFLRGSLPLLSPLLDVPTFAARCLHVRNDARDPNSQRRNCERVCCLVILPKWRLPRHLGIYMPQIYDMGPTALLPFRRKACLGFFDTAFSPIKSASPPHSHRQWQLTCRYVVLNKQSIMQLKQCSWIFQYSSPNLKLCTLFWI